MVGDVVLVDMDEGRLEPVCVGLDSTCGDLQGKIEPVLVDALLGNDTENVLVENTARAGPNRWAERDPFHSCPREEQVTGFDDPFRLGLTIEVVEGL